MSIVNGVVRGTVIGGGDPTGRGRMQVQLPALAGSASVWAPVCRAFGGAGDGGGAAVGGAVWVAFEHGDPSHPVVLGLAE